MIFALGGLLGNMALSLLGAWAVAILVARLLRRPAWAKWALALPFLKVAFDLAHGIRPDAFVRSAHAAGRWQEGRFMVGLSLQKPLLPSFQGHLGARVGEQWFGLSAGDLAAQFLRVKVGPTALAIVVCSIAAVSVALAARRIAAAIAFERARRRDRIGARGLGAERAWGRSIDVYLSIGLSGAPFTGGLLRPYVCFPSDAIEALDEHEQRAVLAHELGHARALDAPILFALGLVTDLAWFVPGVRRLLASVRAHAERAADDAAVRAGAEPARLASAIVRLAERGLGVGAPVTSDAERGLAVPFTRRGGPTRARIEALLAHGGDSEARWRVAIRWLLAAALVHAALFSTFLTHG